MTDNRVPITGAQQTAGLTQTELQALFRLVIKKPVPSPADTVPAPVAMLVLTAGILKGYGFDQSSVLTILARLWAWLDDDDYRAMTLNVVDRRYVGWHCMAKTVLVDMTTSEEISPDRPLPRVLESVAYSLYELLERQLAMTRGERASLWEGRNAHRNTPRGEATESGDGLGEPQVLRDDAGAPVS